MKPVSQMEPHEKRVMEEMIQLAEKRAKLGLFIAGNDAFGRLPADEQRRLRRQFDVMIQYEAILQERVENFPPGFTPYSGIVT